MKERFPKRRVLYITGMLVMFGIWTWFVIQGGITDFDALGQKLLFPLRADWLTAIVGPFTYSGNWPGPAAVCLVLLIIPATRFTYGIPMSISSLSSVGVYQAIKYTVQRTRPDKALHLVVQGGYSYVSGHSQTSLITWGMLILLLEYYYINNGASLPVYKKTPRPCTVYPHSRKILKIWTACLSAYILLMGLSRLYVGVHWPSDIIGGWMMGSVILTIFDGVFSGQLYSGKRLSDYDRT